MDLLITEVFFGLRFEFDSVMSLFSLFHFLRLETLQLLQGA